MRAIVGRGTIAALLTAAAWGAGAAEASATVHCDPATATVQGTKTVEIPVACTDSLPAPGSHLWLWADPPSAGAAWAASDHSLSFRASATPSTVTFTYGAMSVMPVPGLIGPGTVLGQSERATVTVTVTDPPPPPPKPVQDNSDPDGDGWGNFQDRCPSVPGGAPAGWVSNTDTKLDGCPLRVTPPFTREDALPHLAAAARAFVAAWKNPATRAAALRTHRLDVPFRIPRRRHGHGLVRAGLNVFPWHLDRLTLASVYGIRWCKPGSLCVVHANVVPQRVRAVAGQDLRLNMSFDVNLPSFGRHSRLWTPVERRIRMG